jgi:hypothetical protein
VVSGHAQLALQRGGEDAETNSDLQAILDAVNRAGDTLHAMGNRFDETPPRPDSGPTNRRRRLSA